VVAGGAAGPAAAACRSRTDWSLAAQAEAVRPAADLKRARDLQTGGARRGAGWRRTASDKYAGRPFPGGAGPVRLCGRRGAARARVSTVAGGRPAAGRAESRSGRRRRRRERSWRNGRASRCRVPRFYGGRRRRSAAGAGRAEGGRTAGRRRAGLARLRRRARVRPRNCSASSPGPGLDSPAPRTRTIRDRATTQDSAGVPAARPRTASSASRTAPRRSTAFSPDQERLAHETQSSAASQRTRGAGAGRTGSSTSAQRIEEVRAPRRPVGRRSRCRPSVARNADDPNWRWPRDGRGGQGAGARLRRCRSTDSGAWRRRRRCGRRSERVEMAKREAAAAPATEAGAGERARGRRN
jgi:hypothetical protein